MDMNKLHDDYLSTNLVLLFHTHARARGVIQGEREIEIITGEGVERVGVKYERTEAARRKEGERLDRKETNKEGQRKKKERRKEWILRDVREGLGKKRGGKEGLSI